MSKTCDFECLFEINKVCLLDKAECGDDCSRYEDCRFCEMSCSKESHRNKNKEEK